jgi:TPR repeat protein
MQLIFGPAVSREYTSHADRVTDFRLERLRRSLKTGRASDAFAVAEKYASSGLAEAQYILGEILSTRGQAGDAEAAQSWYEAAANQGHAAACKALWCRDEGRYFRVDVADADALERSIRFMCQSADLGDPDASMVLVALYGGKPNCDKIPNMLEYLQRHAALGISLAQYYLGYAHDMGHFGAQRDVAKAFELYMQSAQQGNAQAQCWLGICYGHGLGVKQDEEQAVYWYRESAKRGNAQAQYNLGHWYAIGHKPCIQSMSEANRWYRRAALRDFPQAQHNLGLSYRLGSALPQNHELANRWIARAAQHGLPEAQCTLGVSYERGLGVDPNPSKAAELYATAATSGYALAQHKYAYLLEYGLGVAKNPVEAVRWYLAAAEQGLAVAQDNLATMYMDGSGIEKDLTEAVKWRRKAAEQGLANAQCNLAWMYANGVGVEKSDTEALHRYRAAAEQGHANAQCNLAWMYVNGVGVEKSDTEALHWYRAAAEQGLASAQCDLAWMYVMGVGVEKSPTEALRWYQAAAEQGHANAQCNLAWMYANGVGVEKSDAEALHWCRAAAEQGLANAQYNFALMYLNGIGVDKDPTKALRWCQAAAEQGLANAQHNLAWMYVNGVGVDKNPTEALRWCQVAAEQGHAIAQRELAVYISQGGEQRELTEARNALNAIEARLGSTDPAYAAKKALLVPILKPIFAQMPPSKWAAAFEQAYAGVQLPSQSPIPPQSETAAPMDGDRREPAKDAPNAARIIEPLENILSPKAPFLCRWWRHQRRVVNIIVERQGKKRVETLNAYIQCLRCGYAELYNGTPLSVSEIAERDASAQRMLQFYADPVIVTRPARQELRRMRRIFRHSGFVLSRYSGRLALLDLWLQKRWNVWRARALFRRAGITVSKHWNEITMIVAAARIDPVLHDYFDIEEEIKKLRQECQPQQQQSTNRSGPLG